MLLLLTDQIRFIHSPTRSKYNQHYNMKVKTITSIITALATPFVFAAEEKHDHDHEKETAKEHAEHAEHDDHEEDDAKKGPNGGHLIESKDGFIIEVVVDKDRKARIVFLDKENKAIALEAQSITGIAGERSAPVKLTFAKGKVADANVLISDVALPAGAHVAMLLMVKTTADAKATTERFEMHLH